MPQFLTPAAYRRSVFSHVTGMLPARVSDRPCSGNARLPRRLECYQRVTGSCFRIAEAAPTGGRQGNETADAKWLSREFLGHSWRVSGWKGKQETIRHGVAASNTFKERKSASSRTLCRCGNSWNGSAAFPCRLETRASWTDWERENDGQTFTGAAAPN